VSKQRLATPTAVPVGSVPEGKVIDFLSGKPVNDTPEEYVRQNLEKALVRQYRYEPADCGTEVRIKVGSSTRKADIVVFSPGSEHIAENAYIIVETKRPGSNPNAKQDGIDQLKSYMSACLNARYGMWTNGDDRFCFARREKRGSYVFDPVQEIPGMGQTENDVARPKKSSLVPATADNLLFAFRRCHNYIAANEGKQKSEAFWELLKLIFTKIEDERSNQLGFYVTPTERSTATNAKSAKVRIQDIFTAKVVKKYPTIFSAHDREIDLKPAVVAFVVSQLQIFSLLRSPVDVKGIAYEEIVGSNLRGDRGEFFTPRNACRMAVEMLDPQPDERLLDPSCGTGGFLITAMNHSLDIIESSERESWLNPDSATEDEHREFYRRRAEYLSTCVHGIDLNPALVRAAKMNMVMNNDGEGGLFQANTLANPHSWTRSLAKTLPLGSVDVIVSNPPFGANMPIDDDEILGQYELARVWDQDPDTGQWISRMDRNGVPVLQKSQPPEILFIERNLQFLRPGTGRMAIVVPNGILNNPGLAYVRSWILENAQILGVVDMHRDLFQPKNDTQTSIVLLRRLSYSEKTQAETVGLDYPIFMAVAEKVGHDKRGSAIYRRLADGTDMVVERTEIISGIDIETGAETLQASTVRERQLDDELPEVAAAYINWLEAQK
jgi:type I restriction enzyme M protein